MLKRLLQSCAAALLLGSPALAADPGTFTPPPGQNDGGGAAYPSQTPAANPARDQEQFQKWDDYIRGTDATPQEPPQNPSYAPQPQNSVAPQPFDQPQSVQPPPAVPQVQMQQGRIFRYGLPQGWRANETVSGVDLIAPDGVTVVSHALLRGMGQMTPDQCLRTLIAYGPQMGINNVKVLSARPLGQQGNLQATAYDLSYQFNGTPVEAVSIFTVSNSWGGYMVDAMTVQAPPQILRRDVQQMIQLAQNVVVTNTAQVCGNDQLIQLQPSPPSSAGSRAGSSNPIGDMIVKGEEERNKIRDQTALHDSDVRRGQTRWQNPDGGTVVTPNDAARTFVTPGGTGYYNTRYNDPPPPNTTELNPYNYGH